jgi:hypothetical protein
MDVDIRQFREGRSAFPWAELAKYRGNWVAFSMDGRRIVASAPDFLELDALLKAMGEDPERVGFEFIDFEDTYLGGAETL